MGLQNGSKIAELPTRTDSRTVLLLFEWKPKYPNLKIYSGIADLFKLL